MRIWARQARIAALWQSEHQRAQTVAAASIPTKSLRTLQLAALPASLHAFAFPWLFFTFSREKLAECHTILGRKKRASLRCALKSSELAYRR
jgi:hypothetical protein